MKIYGYTVTKPNQDEDVQLESILNEIIGIDSVEKRTKTNQLGMMRIEHIEFDDDHQCYKMDFVRIRMNSGPARGGKTKAVESFELAPDEGFCEETAAIYYPSENLFIAQYNHNSVTHSAMREYFGKFHGTRHTVFSFNPILEDNILEKILNSDLITNFKLKINPKLITDEDLKKNKAVKGLLNNYKRLSQGEVKIEFFGSRKEPLHERIFKPIAKWVINRPENDLGGITGAQITSGSEESQEILNLLQAKIVVDAQLSADPVSKRILQDHRYEALINSKKKFI